MIWKKIVDNLEEAQKFILDIKKFATFKKEIVTIADNNLVNMKIVLSGFYHLPSQSLIVFCHLNLCFVSFGHLGIILLVI